MIRVGERLINVEVSSSGATSRHAKTTSWGVNSTPAVVRQTERREPVELREEAIRQARLRATVRHAQRPPRKSFSTRRTSGAVIPDTKRLLKLHALGPHSDLDRAAKARPEPLSSADQQLIANASALFGTAKAVQSRKSSVSGLKPRPISAAEDCDVSTARSSTRSCTPARTESSNRPTYRSWIPPDKAHEAFIRSIHRERANFDRFADEEIGRRDSIWTGWKEPSEAPKRTRVPSKAEEIRESLRRPTGRGFNGPPWDPTEGLRLDEVRPNPERAEALLARTRASMVGYCYDHQGYI